MRIVHSLSIFKNAHSLSLCATIGAHTNSGEGSERIRRAIGASSQM